MFNFFGVDKNVIKAPQILICSIGEETEFLQQEGDIYHAYQNITKYRAANTADLIEFMRGETFAIVHVEASITAEGIVAGMPGIRLLRQLVGSGAKLVIFASPNPVDNYLAAFPAKERTGFVEPNMVLTLDRKGGNFAKFFGALFEIMAKGKTMQMAWVKLAPQGDGPWMKTLPDTIFEANLGQIKFIP